MSPTLSLACIGTSTTPVVASLTLRNVTELGGEAVRAYLVFVPLCQVSVHATLIDFSGPLGKLGRQDCRFYAWPVFLAVTKDLTARAALCDASTREIYGKDKVRHTVNAPNVRALGSEIGFSGRSNCCDQTALYTQ